MENSRHLEYPICRDRKRAIEILRWTVEQINRPQKQPHIVVVIKELADLIRPHQIEVENAIFNISMNGSAAGIHLIVAAERISHHVITGLIRASLKNRICLAVKNHKESELILNNNICNRSFHSR